MTDLSDGIWWATQYHRNIGLHTVCTIDHVALLQQSATIAQGSYISGSTCGYGNRSLPLLSRVLLFRHIFGEPPPFRIHHQQTAPM